MEINIWQVLFQALNFGVVLFILNKVLYKPVTKLLDERAKKINEGMALAEQNAKNADESDKLKKSEIAKARKEAMGIIRAAEADAKKSGDQIIDKARAKAKDEAERILKNADSELATQKREMEAKVIELAHAMAQKALTQAVSEADASKITKAILASQK